MRRKKEPLQVVDALRPYVKRALEDPALRDDLVAAFAAARGLYEQLARSEGVKGKAETVSEKEFQKKLQSLVAELSDASGRIRGEKEHRMRNRVLLLTGVTLGVLFNPWTGPATREWIMKRITGEDGAGLEELGEHPPAQESAEAEAAEAAPVGASEEAPAA